MNGTMKSAFPHQFRETGNDFVKIVHLSANTGLSTYVRTLMARIHPGLGCLALMLSATNAGVFDCVLHSIIVGDFEPLSTSELSLSNRYLYVLCSMPCMFLYMKNHVHSMCFDIQHDL